MTTEIEHPAVMQTFSYLERNGFEVTYVPVLESGQVSPAAVAAALRPDTIWVSIMFANNELGAIQPIEDIAKIVHSHGALFHTDAVQAFCNIPIDESRMGIDLLSLSGHKIYGPKGIGALYVKNGVNLHPLLHGGMQEAGQRAGTENVPAIVGLGCAAKWMHDDMHTRTAAISDLRDYFENRILNEISDTKVNGAASNRLPGPGLTFTRVRSRQLINILSDFGIYASTGSACSCLTNMHSYVLRAIGLTDSEIEGTIRFSLGKENTISDIDQVINVLKSAVSECRKAN